MGGIKAKQLCITKQKLEDLEEPLFIFILRFIWRIIWREDEKSKGRCWLPSHRRRKGFKYLQLKHGDGLWSVEIIDGLKSRMSDKFWTYSWWNCIARVCGLSQRMWDRHCHMRRLGMVMPTITREWRVSKIVAPRNVYGSRVLPRIGRQGMLERIVLRRAAHLPSNRALPEHCKGCTKFKTNSVDGKCLFWLRVPQAFRFWPILQHTPEVSDSSSSSEVQQWLHPKHTYMRSWNVENQIHTFSSTCWSTLVLERKMSIREYWS